MARTRRSFVCRQCGAEFPAWAGRCSRCQEWGAVEEVDARRPTSRSSASGRPRREGALVALGEVDGSGSVPTPTGVDEIDRVLGGGLTAGSSVLLGGEPGVGKSTLTLQLALGVSAQGAGALLVAGEEAPAQIAARARRLGPVPPSLAVIDDTSVAAVEAALESTRPLVAIVDSIQMMSVDEVDAPPGSVAQLKAATERLVDAARRFDVSVVMVGHLTKDGALAGPRLIEHLVDTVLSFEGDRGGDLRYLRAVKHRFGPTSELGLFEMTSGGLDAVEDPSDRFLADRRGGQSGSIVVPTLHGRRPLLIELQALTVATAPNPGKATVQGLDGRRLAIVSAVLNRRAGCPLTGNDVFASVTGGVKVTEPAADLGLAIALASALGDFGVRADLVACGEIGLGGEVRSVPQLGPRLQEAHRLGFRTAIVPASAPDGPTGMTLWRAETIVEALGYVGRGQLAA